MKTKKVKKVINESMQPIIEAINCHNLSMPVHEENNQVDDEKEKTILDCKFEEAKNYKLETTKRQLRETACRNKELSQYKRELDKERKARKKAVEQQKELKYLFKDIKDKVKDIEKKQQEFEKKQKKKYKKLKAYVKKKDEKKKKDIGYIENILSLLFLKTNAFFPIEYFNLKEIAAYCKKEKKQLVRKNTNQDIIDCNYKYID